MGSRLGRFRSAVARYALAMTKRPRKPSGIDDLASIPLDLPPFETFLESANRCVDEFRRARRNSKSRARNAMMVSSILAGVAAVLGAVSASSAYPFLTPWVGWGIAAVSAALAVVTNWDNFFGHRALWVQRSLMLHTFEHIKRTYIFKSRLPDADLDALAIEGMAEIEAALELDVETWRSLGRGGSGGIDAWGNDRTT